MRSIIFAMSSRTGSFYSTRGAAFKEVQVSRPFLITGICAAESPAGPGPACRCPGPGPADSAHCPGSLSSDSPENETSESAAATAERGRLRCARPWRQCLGRRHHGIGECGSCGCHLRLGH